MKTTLAVVSALLSAIAINAYAETGHDTHESSVYDTHASTPSSSSHKPQASKAHGAHWGYKGKEGPEHWGDLSKDYVTCKTGEQQTPINIRNGITAVIPPIIFNYKSAALAVLNNGHTIQVQRPGGSYIWVGNHRYDLAQFHFHSPSENVVNGMPYPLEMHLVHKDAHGNLAVVGVLFKEGEENQALKKVWNIMPKRANDTKHATVALSASDLLPDDKSYYHFMGSLTTPPCSEGVSWYMLRAPLELSRRQITQFNNIMPDNARPVQPLNNRLILMSE